MEHSKTIESALSTSSVKTLARTEPSQVTIPKAVKKQARIPEVGVESPFANELWLNQLRTSLYSNETKGRVFETIRRVSLEEVQPAVTEDDRRAAVDSLVRFSLISKEHGCERVTLGIAVRLMDLMLRLRPFSRDDFVILANTCYHLATKVSGDDRSSTHDCDQLSFSDGCYLSRDLANRYSLGTSPAVACLPYNTVTPQGLQVEEVYQVDADARIFTDKARGMGARHIVAMGDIILRALDYKLGGVDIVTAAHFAPLFLGAAGLPADNEEALWEEGYAVPPRAVMDVSAVCCS